MNAELLGILNQITTKGLWAIVLYKGLDILGILLAFFMFGYGIRKAWPALKKFLEK